MFDRAGAGPAPAGATLTARLMAGSVLLDGAVPGPASMVGFDGSSPPPQCHGIPADAAQGVQPVMRLALGVTQSFAHPLSGRSAPHVGRQLHYKLDRQSVAINRKRNGLVHLDHGSNSGVSLSTGPTGTTKPDLNLPTRRR